jgi:hypothetical protein
MFALELCHIPYKLDAAYEKLNSVSFWVFVFTNKVLHLTAENMAATNT